MKLYELVAHFDNVQPEESYFSSLDAAMTEVNRLKSEAEASGLYDICLNTIAMANLPPKQLLLAVLNRKGFIQHNGRVEFYSWNRGV